MNLQPSAPVALPPSFDAPALCRHLTLRPGHLPCPHPACGAAESQTVPAERRATVASAYVVGGLLPSPLLLDEVVDLEVWTRLKVPGLSVHESGRPFEPLWGWRRVR